MATPSSGSQRTPFAIVRDGSPAASGFPSQLPRLDCRFQRCRCGSRRWPGRHRTGVGGTAADRARLGEPVGDRLVLAGEAIHSTWPAMAHGAYGTSAGLRPLSTTDQHPHLQVDALERTGCYPSSPRRLAALAMTVPPSSSSSTNSGRATPWSFGSSARKLQVVQDIYWSGHYTVAAIAKTLGVSRASIYRHLTHTGS
jgi:hypothetical protein